MAPPSRPWVGRVLRAKWRIDARIARGGVGTVWAATHKNNGSRAAIKILHPEFARDEDTKSRFLAEGYAANQVNHPGVVRILDDDVTEEGAAFLVMELLEGELLEKRRLRKGGTLPLPEVYDVADQLLDVLASAHAHGIIHRDIKPDNLFITREGKLKVLDFGFAQIKSGFRSERTATGFLLGTPGFMSPEQSIGNREEIDARTDIWAVGATLFTLISGEPVHAATTAPAKLLAAARSKARSLAVVAARLPPQLVAVVDRALAFDIAARWPDAVSMQNALRSVPGRQMPADSRRSIPDSLPPDTLIDRPLTPFTDDGPTIMTSSPALASLEGTPYSLPIPRPPSSHPLRDESTQGMDSGHPISLPPTTAPMPPAFVPQTYENPGTRVDMMFVAGPARPAPVRTPASRAIVFVAVAVLSMAIVIITGLLILGASD